MLPIKNLIISAAKATTKFVTQNKSTICMVLGTAGFLGTCKLVADAAPAVEDTKLMLEEVEFNDSKEKTIAYLTECVKPYGWAIGLGAASLGCFWAGHVIDIRATAAATGALTMLNEAYKADRQRALEAGQPISLPPASEEDLQEIEQNFDNAGDDRQFKFYDKVTGQTFMSTKSQIRGGEAEIARRCAEGLEGDVPLNDLLDIWGADDRGYAGEALGFDEKCLPNVDFRPALDEHQSPMIALVYSTTVINRNALRK